MTTLVFVHGACVRDAPWWWSEMVAPLAERGIASATVALPSCGEGPGDVLGDLYDDVEACRRVIAGTADGPVVLCGHSYGGMVITEAGADPRVTQLLYVTSVMPGPGESQGAMTGAEPAPWLQPADDGTVGVDADLVRRHFLQDCDRATADAAAARLTRQSLTPFSQPARATAWEDKPTSYIVCSQDLATPAEVQRRRARAGTRVVEIDAGHHPFLSQPTTFAHLIADEVVAIG